MRTRATKVLGLLLAAGLAGQLAPAEVGAATNLFPDLKMAIPRDFYIQVHDGQRRLRFTTFIRNAGEGPFVLHGRRASTSEAEMEVRQRVYDSSGSSWTFLTPAVMRFAGSEAGSDGHFHWHTMRISTYELYSKTGDVWAPTKRTGRKTGFCFFDTDAWKLSLPGAPRSPVYGEHCGSRSSLKVKMGLSVGWADKYPASFAWQWIDVANLKTGVRYRVCVTVDKERWFREIDIWNNRAWAEVSWSKTSSGAWKVVVHAKSFRRCDAPGP